MREAEIPFYDRLLGFRGTQVGSQISLVRGYKFYIEVKIVWIN